MSTPDPHEPAAQAISTEGNATGTFLAHHNGEDGMGLRSMTVGRYEEIRRRLADGRGIREIARALGCSRDTVREVRDGVRHSPDAPTICNDPLWMQQVNWLAVIHDLGLGHPLKFIWEEKAQQLTTYSNFWKQFYRETQSRARLRCAPSMERAQRRHRHARITTPSNTNGSSSPPACRRGTR